MTTFDGLHMCRENFLLTKSVKSAICFNLSKFLLDIYIYYIMYHLVSRKQPKDNKIMVFNSVGGVLVCRYNCLNGAIMSGFIGFIVNFAGNNTLLT